MEMKVCGYDHKNENGMNMDKTILGRSALFRSMDEREIEEALRGTRAYEKSYQKGEILLHAGFPTAKMGLVLEGSVLIESNDLWGSRTILSHVGPGQYFAETYAMLPEEPLLVDAAANEDCRVAYFFIGDESFRRETDASWKIKLVQNLLRISMQKNLTLSGRSFHTAPKTIRGRVMAYLNTVSIRLKSRSFEIPFDRQELADYLNLDRSALSKELGRMRKEGIIIVKKNHFEIMEQ